MWSKCKLCEKIVHIFAKMSKSFSGLDIFNRSCYIKAWAEILLDCLFGKKIPQNPCCCTKAKNAFVKLAEPDFAETLVKKFTYKQSMELDINSSQCAWFNFKFFELVSKPGPQTDLFFSCIF